MREELQTQDNKTNTKFQNQETKFQSQWNMIKKLEKQIQGEKWKSKSDDD